MKWWHRLGKYPELWVLSALALLTRLWQLGTPNEIVFDEVYFREFASNYLSGAYFFDIHPPIIKLVFAGVGTLFGFSPEQVASGDDAVVALRLLPAVAGAMLVPLVYVVARQLGLGRRFAAFAGALVLLDNALLVESRFVLMDSMMLLAGIGAVSCYLALRKRQGIYRWPWLVAAASLLGVTASTKWSGLAVVLLVALVWLYDVLRSRTKPRRILGELAVATAIVAGIYAGSFALHFALLPNSGEGDAFMSWKFQSTLRDNPEYSSSASMSFGEKIIELNGEMYRSGGSVGEHSYSSRWYSWPFMTRPVYYWQGSVDQADKQGHIYMLGNPVVWWGTTFATICLLSLLLLKHSSVMRYEKVAIFLLLGYGVNYIPFVFIDRPMFMYHYLFALIFAILIAGLMVKLASDYIADKYGGKLARVMYLGLLGIVLVGFVYVLPLSYGWPLSDSELMFHMLLPSWR